MIYNSAIIGGGAAGLCAAISLKQRDPSASVVILERLPRVGKKLITTGNGRCNITNLNITLERYHGEDPAFCQSALEIYDRVYVEEFFAEMGVVFTFDEVGRAYPYSLQASSVVDALRYTAELKGVEIRTETTVTALQKKGNTFLLQTELETVEADTVLVATGLLSGGNAVGCDGLMLRALQQHGFRVNPTTPAIVQLKTETDVVRQLKGIKVNGTVTLLCDGKPVRSETGEILFCDYGLSGPPILQVSRAVERTPGQYTVRLDLMPDYEPDRLYKLLQYRVNTLYNRTVAEFFTGLLNKRVGQVLMKSCGYAPAMSVAALHRADILKISQAVKDFKIRVTGTTGFANSQVTAGGLDTAGFDPQTMMSRKIPGLFAAGEILDIDGDCGGFNLQWAWSSAMCAADGICIYLGELQ